MPSIIKVIALLLLSTTQQLPANDVELTHDLFHGALEVTKEGEIRFLYDQSRLLDENDMSDGVVELRHKFNNTLALVGVRISERRLVNHINRGTNVEKNLWTFEQKAQQLLTSKYLPPELFYSETYRPGDLTKVNAILWEIEGSLTSLALRKEGKIDGLERTDLDPSSEFESLSKLFESLNSFFSVEGPPIVLDSRINLASIQAMFGTGTSLTTTQEKTPKLKHFDEQMPTEATPVQPSTMSDQELRRRLGLEEAETPTEAQTPKLKSFDEQMPVEVPKVAGVISPPVLEMTPTEKSPNYVPENWDISGLVADGVVIAICLGLLAILGYELYQISQWEWGELFDNVGEDISKRLFSSDFRPSLVILSLTVILLGALAAGIFLLENLSFPSGGGDFLETLDREWANWLFYGMIGLLGLALIVVFIRLILILACFAALVAIYFVLYLFHQEVSAFTSGLGDYGVFALIAIWVLPAVILLGIIDKIEPGGGGGNYSSSGSYSDSDSYSSSDTYSSSYPDTEESVRSWGGDGERTG